jgi:hypothetical protein
MLAVEAVVGGVEELQIEETDDPWRWQRLTEAVEGFDH